MKTPVLNTREAEVLKHIVAGLMYKEVAVEMKVSKAVVNKLMQRLFDKFGVRTRAELANLWYERRKPRRRRKA